MTTITSNGSKWLGEQPDTIEQLESVLGSHALDRSFEAYGNFHYPLENSPGTIRFFGNFLGVSHVFNLDTDDVTVITRLRKAIRANRCRVDYQSQTKPATRCHRPGGA